ncbi:MAG: TRAP transporter large permease subunit [Clostridiaceae bacterium]|nr:TRAP transporter large permease subunit [Clostridiaceae bacterium]
MPIEIAYLVILLAAICLVFVLFKRPIYEAMFIAYVVMIAVTGKWSEFFKHLYTTSTNTLFYAIVAFLAAAQIFGATKIIDQCIAIILSIFGRIRGGAGYVALVGSTFMGSLSGSGAGNVAATGVFTIPAMKRSGFPAHLAANVEMAASTMGNMIPPAGVITAAYGVLNSLYPDKYTMSNFWIVMWGISLWFILQRTITLYVFCRYYKVKPMDKKDIPRFGEAIKKGWTALLLPVIIFLPFFLDSRLKATFFTARLGEGAGSFSSCILLFTPGLAALYAMLISRKKADSSPKAIASMLGDKVKSIVPVCATIFFAYSISNLFGTLNVGENIGAYISGWGLPLWVLAFFIPLFTALLGMVLPGSSQTAIFGSALVSIFVGAGGNPFLAAAMLPVITGAMEGMTPPLALCMYTAMGIAGSRLKETTINCLIWVGLHYLLSVIVMLGFLPIWGLM